MPLFHRKSEDDRTREQQARVEADATMQSLAGGGIPIAAQRRLDQLNRDGGLFTSDLSVNEFLLARQTGMRPITQVMGTSMYHVGWQNLSWSYFSSELDVLTRAYTEARRLALGRMSEEAERVGAHVVAGVRIEFGRSGIDAGLVEFRAFGTAMQAESAPQIGRVALTNLSGQDFWKLYANGYWPLGVATGSTVFHAVNTWRQQMGTGFFGGWMNQEMQDFTASLYQARALALGRVQQEAMSLRGAEGLVGVSLDQEQEEIEVSTGNDQERTDMLFTFHVIGTCIGKIASDRHTPVRTALDLTC